MSVYNRRRRGGSRTVGFMAFLLAAALMLMLSTTLLFNVKNISVTGESNYTAQDIIDASGIKAGDNLVRTATDRMESKIENKLVYIEKAEIKRSFPDTLVINVEACVPAANFICDKYTLLISRGGKILDRIDEPKAGLLNFTGVEPYEGLLPGDIFRSADEHKTEVINEIMNYYTAEGTKHSKDKITVIDVSDRSNISYTFDNRIEVKIGSVNDLEYKMDFSREIITKKIGDRTEGVLTILSDATRASFLDKESLENNARVFRENMAALEAENGGDDEDSDEDDDSGSGYDTPVRADADPIME